MQGSVVTQLCQDYGLIDHSVYFTAGEVLGGVPLHVGDVVNTVAVRDGAHGGWKALRVGAIHLVHFNEFSLLINHMTWSKVPINSTFVTLNDTTCIIGSKPSFKYCSFILRWGLCILYKCHGWVLEFLEVLAMVMY